MSNRTKYFIRGKNLLARPYYFKECGLPHVRLLNGVSINKTPYGEMVRIQHLHGLIAAICLHIIEKKGTMSGGEFRFLRKQMKLRKKIRRSVTAAGRGGWVSTA